MADAFLMVTENIYKALTMRYFETRILLTFIMATALIGSNAHAACTMPGGAPDAGAGDIIFNGPPNNVMQYCDGTNWVAMSGGGGGVPELPSAEIFVGNASNVATARAVSGDATLSNAGVLTIGNNAITSAKIADGTIVGADIANATITTNKMSAGGTANGTTFLRGDGQWVAPTFSYTETDPKVSATTNDKWCRGDGSAVVCDQDTPSGGGGGAAYEVFTASGTWTKPGTGAIAFVQCWGGGSSGHRSTVSTVRGGGGGGYNEIWLPLATLPGTVSVTVGAGGAARTSNGVNPGGTSNFGTYLYAYGGNGANGGGPVPVSQGSAFLGGTTDGGGTAVNWGTELQPGVYFTGGGGGCCGGTYPGGSAMYGGGGGAGTGGSGGTSMYGGSGGTYTADGSPPGGGGGAGRNVNSGAGARGECRVTVF